MSVKACNCEWKVESTAPLSPLTINLNKRGESNLLAGRVTFDWEARFVVNFIGAPGSGKGTQAGFLRTELTVPHLSLGDIFRYHMRENTDLGVLIKHHVSLKGSDPVPEELTSGMVISKISEKDYRNGFILDGFPRSVKQVDLLARALLHPNDLHVIIYFDIQEAAILERFKTPRYLCGDCGTQIGAHALKEKQTKEPIVCIECSSTNVKPREESQKINELRERIHAFEASKELVLAALKEKFEIHQLTLTGNESPDAVFERVAKIVYDRMLYYAIRQEATLKDEKYG